MPINKENKKEKAKKQIKKLWAKIIYLKNKIPQSKFLPKKNSQISVYHLCEYLCHKTIVDNYFKFKLKTSMNLF